MLSVQQESTVQNPNNPHPRIGPPIEPLEASPSPWHQEVRQLFTRAADLCVQHGLDLDDYMTGAWAAYVEARPGLRAHLEELGLRAQLDELRKLGRMGKA
jgi:hypothetical protein